MKTVQVPLKERSYPIFIGRDLIKSAGRFIRDRKIKARAALVVSQKQIALQYESVLLDSLAKEGYDPAVFITPAAKSSEAAKSASVFLRLVRKIASLDGQNKSPYLVALGGGVVGDLAGFAASIYRRGIPYIQIPTTLTAQVDSAIGGKTGIDLPEGKNLLGSVYQPALVLSDTALLESLPERHWSDGFAEVIKYGVIKDPRLFSWLEKNGKQGIRQDKGLLEKVIDRCARIKARIVAEDERDKKGIRVVLNFGHTAGHAIEAASKFTRQYTHGEAVAIGMLIACDISRQMGLLKGEGLTERLEKTFVKFDLPLSYKGLTVETILKPMGYDKKSDSGVNRFVLPIDIGKTTIARDIPHAVIAEALQRRKG